MSSNGSPVRTMAVVKMKKLNFLFSFVFPLLVLPLTLIDLILPIEGEAKFEPQFPSIFSPLQFKQHRLHIVSESIGEFGYETIEEFYDLDLGKGTLLVTNKRGHRVNHVDAEAGLIYSYKPYSCAALSVAEMKASGYEGFWSAITSFTSKNGSTKDMHLFGVTAVWMNAAQEAKSYSDSNLVHSTSKGVYSMAHKWTIKDEAMKQLVHLYFIENKIKVGSAALSLEMIQFESIESSKIIQTLNILTFEYSIPDEVFESLLMVPVGYGCMNADVTAKALQEYTSIESIYMGPLLSKSHRIQLEATASWYPGTGASVSDTLGYELIRAQSPEMDTLQLIRQRDTNQDTKTILNYRFNVQYEIDSRKGTCKMSNMANRRNEGEQATLKFKNGLEMIMDVRLMKTLFVDSEDFYFIKAIARGSRIIEYLYFERTTRELFGGEPCRIVRTYSKSQLSSVPDLRLESVTVWMFDEKYERITKSYHFNVLDASEISSPYELARLFDVSEECYLNDERMRAGRDYAWFELSYPLISRHSAILASHSTALKDAILQNYMSEFSYMSLFLVPRLELMFEDTGFILRVLMIDIPPLQLLYDFFGRTTVSTVDTAPSTTRTSGLLVEDLASDLDHCADLCRLNDCKIMSYCESSHTCLLSNQWPEEKSERGEVKLIKSLVCDSYTQPKWRKDDNNEDAGGGRSFTSISELKLHRTLSLLQHQDYSAISLPKLPDELTYASSETNIDDTARGDLVLDYMQQVYKYLSQNGHGLPMLTFSLNVGGDLIILLPNKFELESDPLNEFAFATADSSDSMGNELEYSGDRVPPFHEGLSMHRYKMNVFSEAQQKKSRLFSGLTYDQCALACVDSRCSSLSYCTHRQECIITDIYNLGQSIVGSLIEQDSDCFIAQRDFLSKFNKFQNVYRPTIYKSSTPAYNPSECAHSCMVQTDFRCLAFDYCSGGSGSVQGGEKKNSPLNSCYLLEERLLYTGGLWSEATNPTSDDGPTQQQAPGPKKAAVSLPPAKETGCDHYSRSYLADFLRIEYRQIEFTELLKLKATTLEGRSVDQCAEVCVNELTDCSAFQFCMDPDSASTGSAAMQSCVLIESRPQVANAVDLQAVVNEQADSDQVVTVGKFFQSNRNCHIFSLRSDSSEARVRELALGGMSLDEYQARNKLNEAGGGLSIVGGIMLFVCTTLLSAAIGCGVILVKHHNDYVRQKLDRIRFWIGF